MEEVTEGYVFMIVWQCTHLSSLRGFYTAKLTTSALLTRRKRSEYSSVQTVTAACTGVCVN